MQQFIRYVGMACIVLGHLSVAAQDDRWDDLMERAATAWHRADLVNARKFVSDAVYQGKYDTADRYVSSLALQARIEQDAGDLVAAENALRKAIETVDRIPGPLSQDKAVLHNNLGVLLDLASDLSGAEQQYLAALALHKTLPTLGLDDQFSLLANLAGLLERRGDIKNARKYYAEAESMVSGLPSSASISLNNNLAALMHRQGDSAGALHRLNNALSDLNKATTAPLVRASVLHNLGTTELETGEFAIAHEHLREAEAIRRARLGDQHPDTARTIASLSLLMERTRMYPAGLALAREASTSIMTMLAGNAGTRAAAASSQERKEWRAIFSTHLRLLARAEPDTERQAGEALTLIQSLKHGELARVFASASIGSDGAIGQRTRQIRQQMGRFQSKDRELTTIIQSGKSNNAQEASLRKVLAEERAALTTMQNELADAFPQYFELLGGRVAPLATVQSALGADEAVLIYLIGLNESFFVALTNTKARFFQSDLGHVELTKLVTKIRQAVDPDNDVDPGKFAFNEARRIYRELIAPANSVLANRDIWLVIPDGPLESLPFSLLLESDITPGMMEDYSKASWLLRSHAMVTLPSLGALTLARGPTAQAPALASKALIAFADPILGRSGNAPSGVRNASALEDVTLGGELSDRRLANINVIRRLAPLPETADEARAVAAALGGGDLFLGAAAKESTVKQLDLSRYQTVLFATHGVMASDFLEFGEPGLVLSPPSEASETDDGILSASEIAQLKLNADLAVLSACNTAASDGTPNAEGLSGLTKSFFHAGARNLLVSHWSVVSKSTVDITTGLFEQIKRTPKIAKSRALQAAMLKLLDAAPLYRHPMYWAPFVLVGGGE